MIKKICMFIVVCLFLTELTSHAGDQPGRDYKMKNELSGEYYNWKKTGKPERPWLLPYHQTVVTKLFLARKRTEASSGNYRKDLGKCKDVDGTLVYLAFDEVLEVIRKLDNITLGVPKVVYLVGWQHRGHDSKYPDWSVVNPRLKRAEDKTALESLRWLMREAKKYNTAVSLHINMFDAYEDSPLFAEYVKHDIIAKDKDGNLIKGAVAVDKIPRPDTQIYYISYTREWELGFAQKRIDDLLEMLPELVDSKTIHIDAFHCFRPRGPEPKTVISPFLGYTTAQEAATMRKIFRYWRDKGFDVTSEGSSFLRPDRFVGLQPMSWWDEPNDLPQELYCGSSLHAEEEVLVDPENLSGLLDQFCLMVVPWNYRNNKTAVKGDQKMLDPDVGYKKHPRGNLFEQAMANYGNHVFMPALWRDKTIVAYSRTGYENRTWELPPDWKDVKAVSISRITLDGLEKTGDATVSDGKLTLDVGEREALFITPADKSEPAPEREASDK